MKLAKVKDWVFNGFICGLIVFSIFFILELIPRIYHHILDSKNVSIFEQRKLMKAYNYFDWKNDYFKDIKVLKLIYEPYVLYKNAPFESKTINVDQEGCRRTINPVKKEVFETRFVFFFGGSTGFCGEVPDAYTIASYLSKELNEKYKGINFVVVNYSTSGYVSDQEVVFLTQLLTQNFIPNFVVFYDGVNEITSKVYRGEPHAFYENFKVVTDLEKYTSGAFKEHVVRKFYTLRFIKQIFNLDKPDEAKFNENQLIENALRMIDQYKKNTLFVDRLSNVYGFHSIFIWQPNLFSTHKILSDEEKFILNDPKTCQLKQVYNLSLQYVKENESNFINFSDLSGALDNIMESIFIDYCHITAIGNEAVTKKISERISQCLKLY